MNNNIIAAYKYHLNDTKRPVIIYYGIIIALIILMNVGLASVTSADNVSLGGMDFATVIFLLVAGLVSFKESFKMFMQNGVSRKSIFMSTVLSNVTIAFFMAIIDKIITIVCRATIFHMGGLRYNSMFEQVYNAFLPGKSGLLIHIDAFLYNFLLYLTMLTVGLLITLVFYRLNKAGKVAVGVGVPVGLIMVLPLVDGLIFKGGINRALTWFFDFALGLSSVNPYASMITFVLTSVIVFALGWLLMRRAIIKQ